jgi:coiled-coil domain-containing protein 130
LRRRFREEKKVILEKQGRDDGLKSRFGLHDDVDLRGEDVELGKEMWEAQRERAGLPVDSDNGESSTRAIRGTPVSTRKGKGRMSDTPTPNLASLLRKTTARKYDPFSDDLDTFMAGSPTVRGRVKAKEVVVKLSEPEPPDPPVPKLGMAVLAGYDSD